MVLKILWYSQDAGFRTHIKIVWWRTFRGFEPILAEAPPRGLAKRARAARELRELRAGHQENPFRAFYVAEG